MILFEESFSWRTFLITGPKSAFNTLLHCVIDRASLDKANNALASFVHFYSPSDKNCINDRPKKILSVHALSKKMIELDYDDYQCVFH